MKKIQLRYIDPHTLQRIELEIDTRDYPKLIVQPIEDVVFTDEEFERLYKWVEDEICEINISQWSE